MTPVCPPPPPPPPPQCFDRDPLYAQGMVMPVVLDTDLTTVVDMTRAKNIAPHKIDKSIWHLQDSDRILKRGPNVRVTEAEALRFVASSTRVPVPEVFGAYEKDGYGHIFMSRVNGTPLHDVLHILNEALNPVATYSFTTNMPERGYGPFKSRAEYYNGLIDALRNSRPGGEFDDNDVHLIERIQRLGNGRAVFCHGDLTPDNILVDDRLNVVGIVDMGVSGFSIHEREYFEAKSRARNPVWSSMIEHIIPKIPDDVYSLLLELERELVRYSGL
ncbi:hypothetical protein BU25DRAFT_450529 [Macroventuria anomochaeta]|uniref:Uncharacterized protein n=1 Tax=Macroventuria anomochaeta TaxID=301207 RepID=A0ACB6RS50_9PLEO|nr:uncharacterized protein BU25DRAFT_450529 [Macroventuria anomochaeta]KAF2624795.1 hypothetical protein BU25DRAFT_450529 [Macroventuria anomochaeta]